jgi:uncharacterized protein YkwD
MKKIIKSIVLTLGITMSLNLVGQELVKAESTNLIVIVAAKNVGWNSNEDGSWSYSKDGQTLVISNWIEDNGEWYYLNDYGKMASGWKEINGIWYYFDSNGKMLKNTTIDDYKLDSNGAWINGTNNINNQITLDIKGLDPLPQNYDVSVYQDVENQLFNILNQRRQENGLKPLEIDDKLVQFSRYKSDYCLQSGEKENMNIYGNEWHYYMQALGYDYGKSGENLLYGDVALANAETLSNVWWNTPTYKANMLNQEFTHVGVGVVFDKTNNKYMAIETFMTE